jgi:hypothetical protein
MMIKEPKQNSEFEVQAFLWSGLRGLGVNARGEVSVPYAKRQKVRFDIAVFESGVLVGIIEVKARPVNHKTSWEDTRQGKRYTTFGVPIRMVYGMDQANQALADASTGRLWS